MALNNSAHKASSPRARYGEGLQMRPLSVEKGSERYSSKHDIPPPRTANWRCNLTALSQRRNLFFTACSHQISVWEPAGSSQTLGSRPEMIITPVMKEPHGEAYIRPTSPHEINSILVDDLGREEVLLLVTDSGNVCGYRVEAICSALKRAAESGKPRPLKTTEVDPFFIEYVGSSAWGLAIHKFARLIAVSANTGLVTVFAFALVDSSPEKGNDEDVSLGEAEEFTDNGQSWLHIKNDDQLNQLQQSTPDKRRTQNIKMNYTGHFTNIPSVTFLNSDIDPNGTWMVSTDIENKVIVWKVWDSLGPFNCYYLNGVSFRTFPDTLQNDSDRGWTVIALDPRTFHLSKSTKEACGGQPQRRVKDGRTVLDLTRLTKDVPDASRIYKHFPPAVRADPEEPSLPDIFGPDCLLSGDDGTLKKNENRVAPDTVSKSLLADAPSHQATNGSFPANDNASEDNAPDSDSNRENQHITDLQDLLQTIAGPNSPNGVVSTGQEPLTAPGTFEDIILAAIGGDAYEVEALLGEDLSDASGDVEDANNHRTEDQHMHEVDDESSDIDDTSEADPFHVYNPPTKSNFPILHFSHTDIRLIPDPFATIPTVVCGSPLAQHFTHPITSILHFDRFCMVKYIPEHGIVVAATQKGRAAIVALTETRSGGYAFRIDWIVPLESQEKYGDRPLIPLLGMSAGPMQGFEIPADISYTTRDEKDEAGGDNDINAPTFEYKESNGTNTQSQSGDTSPSSPPADSQDRPTLPESHAKATRAYQPAEHWRGLNPSRRYRLLLMFMDHTVMSYEFWYSWNTASDSSQGDAALDEDEYLIL
ncbi:hypothetical protein BJY04DRAFT_183851 [Aspergillus karnatakaensis]|uniref:uncharacterized protein n=1 Tax=Aspergillus karnatakaensis TaxID=1810916 RepID=UPI003CCE1A7F